MNLIWLLIILKITCFYSQVDPFSEHAWIVYKHSFLTTGLLQDEVNCFTPMNNIKNLLFSPNSWTKLLTLFVSQEAAPGWARHITINAKGGRWDYVESKLNVWLFFSLPWVEFGRKIIGVTENRILYIFFLYIQKVIWVQQSALMTLIIITFIEKANQ